MRILIQTVLRLPTKPALAFLTGGRFADAKLRPMDTGLQSIIPYQAPYVSYRQAFTKQIKHSNLSFLGDTVHPNWRGHDLIAQLLANWLKWVKSLPRQSPSLISDDSFPSVLFTPSNYPFSRHVLTFWSAADGDISLFPTLKNSGWDFVMEAKGKFGWVSQHHNSTIEFVVDKLGSSVGLELLLKLCDETYLVDDLCLVTALGGITTHVKA